MSFKKTQFRLCTKKYRINAVNRRGCEIMSIIYPILDENNASRDFSEEFRGYNHNIRIADNEFYDMRNLTADYYPVLSTRKKRAITQQMTKPQAVICKDALCYIDNGQLYINGDRIVVYDGGTKYDKRMIGMGAYLIIFNVTDKGLADGWYINTENVADYGYIDKENEIACSKNITVDYTPCGLDGKEYENYSIGKTAPTNVENGALWLDTSGDVHWFKRWSATQSMWVSISTTYVKISGGNIGAGLKVGDAVTISGAEVNALTDAVREQINTLNSTTIIQSIDEKSETPQWFVVIGIIDQAYSQQVGKVKVSRQAPYMDHICESNNRLWGCRYGINRNGDVVNEIYACKQGDFKNWFCYAGISTDSYAVSVGSDGIWTGCVHYNNYVMFFKENCIHKLYGTMPADYQLIEQKVRGLQKGSEKSLCIVNEILFYKSATDICYYDGSLPVGISSQLGEVNYSNAVAGSIGNKYYISMKNESTGSRDLLVYDIAKQMWHKEDDLNVKEFCRVDTDLFAIESGTNNLINICGGANLEKDFDWYAETGSIGYSYADNKYVGRVLIRLSKPLSSEVRILIEYDDSGEWTTIASLNGGGTRSISLPVLPRRCDHFRIRIEGVGECKIYSISKVLEIGSDG